MSATALSIEGIRAGYGGGEDILKGISLTLRRGAIVAVIGPNGSGKSTLLKAAYGLVPTRAGRTVLTTENDTPIELTGRSAATLTRLGLNMVPQLANTFADLTVAENLEIGGLPIGPRHRQQRDWVLDALPLVRPLLGKRAATLSGGQRQMVALGRALMSDPRVLILDEPSAGLAPKVQDEMFALIKRINGLGVSILMVEQRARQCLAIADYAYVLEGGRNRLEGPAAALAVDPEVIRLYLGGRANVPRIDS